MLNANALVLDGLPLALQPRGIVAEHRHPLDRLRDALAERYRIVGELGRGGMGVVYLAYEIALERPVALKVLPPDLAQDPTQREWLFREARTAAGLSHPNIVPIHAVEEAGEFLFFTMAYVEGETLTQRVERGPLSVEDATWILHDVARAVGYAHGRGVVHCDLKPDNIMIETRTERAVVMDFGVAFLRAKPDIVPAGVVAGTAQFMSPEQVHGKRGDARSDVYALGVTGYYAVTGRVPFDGPTAQDIYVQQLSAQAPPLAIHGEHFDLTYSQAIDRCLQKNPDRRFDHGDDLADALARSPELQRRGLAVALDVFVERMRRLSESSRGLTGLVVIAVYLLITGAWGGEWNIAAGAAAFLGLTALSTALYLLPITRRVLRAGHAHAEMLHALSVDLARDRERREFEYGRNVERFARGARRAAWAGFALVVAGTLLIFVPGTDRTLGLGTGAAGVLIATAASMVGWGYSRRRLNIAGEWWLKFWRSRLGVGFTRLVGADIHREAARKLVEEVTAAKHLATSRIEQLQAVLKDPTALGDGERSDVSWQLTESGRELERLLERLEAVDDPTARERMPANSRAVRAICAIVDSLVRGRTS